MLWGQWEKKLTGSELIAPRGLGVCNSMLPSIEFYMSANSPAHNVEHFISLSLTLPPSPVTVARWMAEVASISLIVQSALKSGKEHNSDFVWLHSHDFSLPDTNAEPPA